MFLMRILGFFVLLAVLVSVFSAGIDTPWETAIWESSNPHIFNVFGILIWDFNVMHASISSISISLDDASQISDEKAKDYLFSTLEWKNKSTNAYVQCNSVFSAVPLSVVSKSESILGSFSFNYKIAQLFAKELFSHSFSECANYGYYWKNTMTNAALLLGRSAELSDSSWLLAKKDFEELGYLGICDSDFYGYSSSSCDTIIPAFSGVSTGDLSDYDRAATIFSKLKKSVYGSVPNLSASNQLLNLIWKQDGSLADAILLRSLMLNATQDSFAEYSDLKSSLLLVRYSASSSLAKPDAQDVSLISAPVKSSVFSEAQAYTISYRLSMLKDSQKKAEALVAQADSFFSFKKRGYLKNTLLSLRDSVALFGVVSNDSSVLLSDSEKVVSIAREEAELEIAAFESSASGHPANSIARSLYANSTISLSSGDSATTLGKKFIFYDKSASLARSARNKLTVVSAEKEADAGADMESLFVLLKNAQKDSIDVEYEKKMLSSIKNDVLSGADWAVALVSELRDSIIEKVRMRYGALEQERAELLYQISLGPEFLGDLSFDMASAEQGVFDASGVLLYPDSIGKLSAIETKYAYTREKIFSASRKIIEKNLIVSSSEYFGPVILDESVNATISTTIHNPTGFSAENVRIPLSPSIDFADASVLYSSSGVDGLTLLQKNGIEIILKNISAYETIQFVIGKQAVLAFTSKKSTSAVAQADATAQIEETISFNLLSNGRFAYTPGVVASDIYLDGSEFRSGSKLLEKGPHTLRSVSSVDAAFSTDSGNFSVKSEGTSSEVSYDLSLIPKLDIDRATIIVNGNWSDHVKSFMLFAYTGEIIENKKDLGNGLFGFDILSLKKNKPVKIRVKYAVDNSKEYAIEQLSVLSKLNSTDATIVSSKLIGNDTLSAISLLEQKRVSSLLSEVSSSARSSSVSKLMRELSSEKDEISGVLSGSEFMSLNETADSQFLSKLQARNSVLENTLSSISNMTNEQAEDTLSKLDKKWLGKQVSAQFNDAESEFRKLKDKYVLLSNASSSTELPKDFTDFEKSSATFEGSGSLSDAINMLGALSSVRDVVLKKENEIESEKASLLSQIDESKSSISEILEHYSKEYSEGKTSTFSWAFKVDPSALQKEIAKKSMTTQDLRSALSSLDGSFSKMNETISFLSNRANSEYSQLNALKSSKSGSWSEQTLKKFNQGMAKAEDYLESGDYVKALKTESALVALAESEIGTDQSQGVIILALSATFVIGVLLIYLFRNRGGFGKEGLGKPQFKKLQSIPYTYGRNQDSGLRNWSNRETGKRSPETSSDRDSIS